MASTWTGQRAAAVLRRELSEPEPRKILPAQGADPRVWSKTELLDGDTSSQHAPSSPSFWGIE